MRPEFIRQSEQVQQNPDDAEIKSQLTDLLTDWQIDWLMDKVTF